MAVTQCGAMDCFGLDNCKTAGLAGLISVICSLFGIMGGIGVGLLGFIGDALLPVGIIANGVCVMSHVLVLVVRGGNAVLDIFSEISLSLWESWAIALVFAFI